MNFAPPTSTFAYNVCRILFAAAIISSWGKKLINISAAVYDWLPLNKQKYAKKHASQGHRPTTDDRNDQIQRSIVKNYFIILSPRTMLFLAMTVHPVQKTVRHYDQREWSSLSMWTFPLPSV